MYSVVIRIVGEAVPRRSQCSLPYRYMSYSVTKRIFVLRLQSSLILNSSPKPSDPLIVIALQYILQRPARSALDQMQYLPRRLVVLIGPEDAYQCPCLLVRHGSRGSCPEDAHTSPTCPRPPPPRSGEAPARRALEPPVASRAPPIISALRTRVVPEAGEGIPGPAGSRIMFCAVVGM